MPDPKLPGACPDPHAIRECPERTRAFAFANPEKKKD